MSWLRDRPRIWVAVALLLIPAWHMRDALLGLGALYQRDVHLYWHHEAEAFVRAVAAGSWPVWDRTVGFGQPLLANSSAQILYPLTWLNLLMRPWWYYTVFVAVHLVLSATGTYRACRLLECTRPGAVAAAVLWTSSGPFLSYAILWHHFAGAAWLPWILAAALRAARAPTTRALLALAAVFAMAVLAGSFEMVAMGAAMAVTAVVWSLRVSRARLAVWRSVFLRAAAAGVLALGLSAGQWMPTLELAFRSGRRTLPRETRTYWSLHPIGAADLLLPGFVTDVPVSSSVRQAFFEGRDPFLRSLYLGLSAVSLVVAGFLDRRRHAGGMLAGAGIVALVFALGRHTPLYDALVTILPPLKAFRYPVKVTVLVALAWCMLAGMGFDFLRHGDARSRIGRMVRFVATGAPALAAVVAWALFAAGSIHGARDLAAGVAISAVAAVCVAAALRAGASRTAAAAAAVIVAVAELTLYHRALIGVAPIGLYAHRPEVLGSLDPAPGARLYSYDYSVVPADPRLKGGPSVHNLARIPSGWGFDETKALAEQLALTPVVASRWGRMGSFEVDYTGLSAVHMQQVPYLLRAMEGTRGHLRMLQLAGVDNVIARHEGPFADLRPVAVVPGLFEAPIRVFGVPDPMPAAYVASRTRAGEGFNGLSVLIDPGFDFRREVLVPGMASPAAGGTPGTARIVDARPDRLRLEVDSPDGGYLVVLESYDPGWRATLDGAPAAIVPANILFRGIHVTPGRHTVEMTYRPASIVAGAMVSALSVLLAVGAWAMAARSSRAAPRA